MTEYGSFFEYALWYLYKLVLVLDLSMQARLEPQSLDLKIAFGARTGFETARDRDPYIEAAQDPSHKDPGRSCRN